MSLKFRTSENKCRLVAHESLLSYTESDMKAQVI